MTPNPARPELFSLDDAGIPTLNGMRDSAGNVFFPAQRFGSEANGDHGTDLTPLDLAGAGTITARAEVHHHPGSKIATPFTVAAIQLDDGLTIRGVLTYPTSSIGDRVRAVTVPSPDGEQSVDELRFELISEEQE